MKRNLLLFISVFLLLITAGCNLLNNPTEKVKEVLNKYQNNSNVVVTELNDYLDTLAISTAHYDKYKNIYLKQYKDLTYEIKDEKIDGDNAVVTTQVEVYDYYTVDNDVTSYIASNPTEFNENGVYDNTIALDYKIDELNKTDKRITYTIDFTLTQVDGKWIVDSLTNEELEKIHGTYVH